MKEFYDIMLRDGTTYLCWPAFHTDSGKVINGKEVEKIRKIKDEDLRK